MATTYTEHLQLPKHAPTDPFNIALINEGFDKTEAGILTAYRGRAAYDLLVNGNFIAPVNQRMLTSYTGASQHTIDRWQTTNAQTSVTVTDDGITISKSAGVTGYLRQVIHNGQKLLGKKLTLAAKMANGTVVCSTTTLPASFPSAITLYATLRDGGTAIGEIMLTTTTASVRIYANSNEESRTFAWVALYEGEYTLETLPNYVQKGYANELMECLRFFHLYATEAARPKHGLDCSPPMRINNPTQGTIVIDGVTYYYNSAEL